MKLLKNDTIKFEKWNNFLLSNKFASPFQSPEYYVLLKNIEGFKANVYAIEDNNELKALCLVTLQKEKGLKSYFTRRAIIYGGPLINESESHYLSTLLKSISDDLKYKIIYIETRNFFDYASYKNNYRQENWEFIPYLNIELDVKGKNLEKIISEMKYNRRREIRLSKELETNYFEASGIEEVKELYSILEELYVNKVKLPLPSLNYFISLFNSPIGKIIVVKHNSKIIGGAFCIYLKGRNIYTMYYCGLREYHNKIFPTHMAIIGAIDFSIKNNLEFIDFMGAGKPSDTYGVRDYKSQFGGVLVEHGRFIKIQNKGLYNLGKLALAVLKKIKSS